MRPRIEHRSAPGAHKETVQNTEPRYEGDLDAVRYSGDATPDPDMVKYIFELQGRVEKGARATEGEGAEKGMDYHEYARLFWAEKAPAEVRDNQEAFAVFEKLLIHDLQHIPMSELVYPEVGQSMVALIQQYGDAINSVGIWSTGDVDATGYQVSKIMRSNVIGGFRRGLRSAVTGMPERRQFLEDKTHYVVDNDKFERLTQFVASRIGSVPAGETMKIVIIEDSKGNFGKAEKALNAAGFEGRFEIVPIWAVYSREGKKAAKEEGFQAEKAKLNGIDSFADLTEQDRFSDLLQDGYLFVDFDGVIGDNIRMREKQAEVTYRAFQSGIALAGSEQLSGQRNQLDLFEEIFPAGKQETRLANGGVLSMEYETSSSSHPGGHDYRFYLLKFLLEDPDGPTQELNARLMVSMHGGGRKRVSASESIISLVGKYGDLPGEKGMQLYRKYLDLLQHLANREGIKIEHEIHPVHRLYDDWHRLFYPVIKDYAYEGPYDTSDEPEYYLKVYKPKKSKKSKKS